jgi:hydrogenase maturation protease
MVDGGTAGLDLLAVMSGREHIVIVDAVEAEGAPGDVIRLRPEELADRPGRPVSLHGISVRDVCGALALLGEQPMVDIVGIVAGDARTVADGLSRAVVDAIPRAAAEVVDIVSSWDRPRRPAGERV